MPQPKILIKAINHLSPILMNQNNLSCVNLSNRCCCKWKAIKVPPSVKINHPLNYKSSWFIYIDEILWLVIIHLHLPNNANRFHLESTTTLKCHCVSNDREWDLEEKLWCVELWKQTAKSRHWEHSLLCQSRSLGIPFKWQQDEAAIMGCTNRGKPYELCTSTYGGKHQRTVDMEKE